MGFGPQGGFRLAELFRRRISPSLGTPRCPTAKERRSSAGNLLALGIVGLATNKNQAGRSKRKNYTGRKNSSRVRIIWDKDTPNFSAAIIGTMWGIFWRPLQRIKEFWGKVGRFVDRNQTKMASICKDWLKGWGYVRRPGNQC